MKQLPLIDIHRTKMALPTKEEISVAIESGHSLYARELSGYEPVPGIIGPESYSGGFCVVFPFVKGNQRKAVRVWHQEIYNIKERYRILAHDFKRLKNKNLLSFEYIENGLNVNGQLLDITVMEWASGQSLKNYILDAVQGTGSKKDITNTILTLAGKLRGAFENMHKQGLSHGDLQHDNIIISADGTPKFIDYDCFYTPSMGNRFTQTTAGYHGYQHPSRFTKSYVSNEKSDYFSELIIYTCLIAIAENPSLVERYNIRESEWMLFGGEDFNDFINSAIYKDLVNLSEEVQKCLSILSDYLSKSDINVLEPFTNFLDEAVQKEKTKQDFLKAQEIGTRQAYQNFLESCPVYSYATYYRNKARKHLCEIEEELSWSLAKGTNTTASYRDYISNSTLKLHISEAKERHEELLWAMAKFRNDEYSYKSYITSTYLNKYLSEAKIRIEEVLWQNALSENTLQAFRKYNSKSKSPRNELSQKLAEFNEQYWEEAQRKDTIAAYDDFLSEFSDGDNANAARARREQLRQEEADHSLWRTALTNNTIVGYKKYIAKSILKLHNEEAEDRINGFDNTEWKEACRIDSIYNYNGYLQKFPSGIHVGEARDKINKIEAKQSFKAASKYLLGAIFIIAIIVVVSYSLSIDDKRPKSTRSSGSYNAVEQTYNNSTIAEELEKKLTGMEVAKKMGDAINPTTLREAEKLLNNLPSSHSNYYKYKQRLSDLK